MVGERAATPGKLLRVHVARRRRHLLDADAARSLDDERLDPTTMALREPTLDDVFLELTGHAAEDVDARDGEATGEGRKAA